LRLGRASLDGDDLNSRFRIVGRAARGGNATPDAARDQDETQEDPESDGPTTSVPAGTTDITAVVAGIAPAIRAGPCGVVVADTVLTVD
jgi:hypothetical protein